MGTKLTIGMAHANDYHGVYFTIQSLRMYHDLQDCELIVIDNTPETEHGKKVESLCRKVGAKYIPFTIKGTTQSREEIFKQASGNAVLCMDCHVLLAPNAISLLKDFYASGDRRDLYSGPLVYDSLNQVHTHFNMKWRSEMWGVWGEAFTCQCGFHYSKDSEYGCMTLETNQQDIPGGLCPKCGGDLMSQNNPIGTNIHEDPFVIPAQGLGLFTCMKKDWLGFNPNFREFGGEECYIHIKYQQSGRKTMCLPFLRWLHRFNRPDGINYPLSLEAKVKNYIHGALELNIDLDPIREHFNKKVPDFMFWKYVDECKGTPKKDMKHAQIKNEIMPQITSDSLTAFKKLVPETDEIADFSNTADILYYILSEEKYSRVEFAQYDKKQHDIFADAIFTEKEVYEPLTGMRCKSKVAHIKAIIPEPVLLGFIETNPHLETIIFSGIASAKEDRLSLYSLLKEKNYGITKVDAAGGIFLVCEKGKEGTAKLHSVLEGPGNDFKKFLKRFGIEATENCKCNVRAKTMNILGKEWCLDNLDLIMKWLEEEAKARNMGTVFAAASLGMRPILKRIIRKSESVPL